MMLKSVLRAIDGGANTFEAIAEKLGCRLGEVYTAVGMLVALGYLAVCRGTCEKCTSRDCLGEIYVITPRGRKYLKD